MMICKSVQRRIDSTSVGLEVGCRVGCLEGCVEGCRIG